MSISSVQAGQAAYNPYATQQNQKQADPAAVNRAAPSDTVQISDEAKQLSQSSSKTTEAGSASFDHNNPPLEAFIMPAWSGQYMSRANSVSLEIDHDYLPFVEDLNKRHIPREEQRQMIRDYLANEPLHQDRLKKDRFRQQYSNEIREYAEITDSAYTKAMETNGLTGKFAYYQKVILDQTVSSEKVHQDFRENLANSSRAIELMKILGIDDAVIKGLRMDATL